MSGQRQQQVQLTLPCPQWYQLQATTAWRRIRRLPLAFGLRQRLARCLHRFSGAVPAAAGPCRSGPRIPGGGQLRQLRTPGRRQSWQWRTPTPGRRRVRPSPVLCEHLLKRQVPNRSRRRLLKHPMRNCSLPGPTTPEQRLLPVPPLRRAATVRRPGCAAAHGAGKRSPTTPQVRWVGRAGRSAQGFHPREQPELWTQPAPAGAPRRRQSADQRPGQPQSVQRPVLRRQPAWLPQPELPRPG